MAWRIRVTDESGLLRALIEAAVRGRLPRWHPQAADQLARAVADEVLLGLKQANVSVLQLYVMGPRDDEEDD